MIIRHRCKDFAQISSSRRRIVPLIKAKRTRSYAAEDSRRRGPCAVPPSHLCGASTTNGVPDDRGGGWVGGRSEGRSTAAGCDPARHQFAEAAWIRGRETNPQARSEEHTSELQSQSNLVCRLLLE